MAPFPQDKHLAAVREHMVAYIVARGIPHRLHQLFSLFDRPQVQYVQTSDHTKTCATDNLLATTPSSIIPWCRKLRLHLQAACLSVSTLYWKQCDQEGPGLAVNT